MIVDLNTQKPKQQPKPSNVLVLSNGSLAVLLGAENYAVNIRDDGRVDLIMVATDRVVSCLSVQKAMRELEKRLVAPQKKRLRIVRHLIALLKDGNIDLAL